MQTLGIRIHGKQRHVCATHDLPKIEVVLVDRKDQLSAGAGETPLMALAPAVGNAIFSATEIRLTSPPWLV